MIPKADVISMQRVNQIEIAPHKPIASIRAIESPLQDAAPRIEITPRRQAIALEIFRSHAPRLKRDAIVAVTIVEPPFIEQQAPFTFQTTVEWRAGEGGQVVESGNVKSLVLCERYRVLKTLRGVAVITEDEGAIDANPMPAQVGKRCLKAPAHRIKRLVHVFEVIRVEALE